MEKDEKLKLVRELDDVISQAKILADREEEILTLLADYVCPYKVGQKAIVKGYAHQGKKCVITKRDAYIDYGGDIAWNVTAQVYKKDGSLSKYWVDWGNFYER